MSNKFLPLDIEHRSNGKLANPQNPKMLACENERDTICVCRLLSLSVTCVVGARLSVHHCISHHMNLSI